ncbi:hypothetical protein AB870_22890 [Pandoraea faecigallinarum]|nr:hypothetical protein AB870_22890 [Pandoraea faecigallinarum]
MFRRISPFIQSTPILKSEKLNEFLKCNLLIKAECLQRTGSFKIRGALNKILLSAHEASPKHLVTWSSGNHGTALAEVARMLKIPATVVVPPWIPSEKIHNILSRGADVLSAADGQDIAKLGHEIARDLGALVIPAYDDIAVIEGQATVTREMLSQFSALQPGMTPDAFLYPCGGGSLIAGAALATVDLDIPIIGVEPEAAADIKISLSKNRICKDPKARATICDALRNPRPGKVTFELMKNAVSDILLVDDKRVQTAMGMLFEHLKLVAEPGGAIAVAAVVANPHKFEGKNIVAVVSGGNVSPDTFVSALRMKA